MTRPVVLAYSDKLFTPSESFIPRGYRSFDRIEPVFIGHDRKGPVPEGFRCIELGSLHGPFGEAGFKQFGLVSNTLRTTLTDLRPVAIHASFGKSGAYALPLARTLKLPLAVTYYGGDATKTTNTKNSPLRVYNRRRGDLWREAKLILPCSDFIRRELLSKGCPDDKMIVHHNTADPERFSPEKRSRLSCSRAGGRKKKGSRL